MAILIRRGLDANVGAFSPSAGEPFMTTDIVRMYLGGAASAKHIVGCKSNIAASAAPTVNDDAGDGYSVNSFWCDVTADLAYICLDSSVGAAVWQALAVTDPELAAIAALTSAADKGIQFTGSGTAATFDLTAAGKALLDDADAAAQRTTLGLGTAATQASSAFDAAGSAASAQAASQPLDSDLTAIAALSPANDDVIQRKAGAWTNRTIAQLSTDLGIVAASETAAGIIELATTTEVQTGTDTTRALTPASVLSSLGAAKGYINFTMVGAGGTINGSKNVSSITDVATGNYTINWNADFANDDYVAVGSAGLSGYRAHYDLAAASAFAAGTTKAVTCNDAGTLIDSDIVCVVAFGEWV